MDRYPFRFAFKSEFSLATKVLASRAIKNDISSAGV